MSAIIGIAALGSFTFHYVSINTLRSLIEYHFREAFTFHYVSINTIVRAVIAYAAVALYIPLCFY